MRQRRPSFRRCVVIQPDPVELGAKCDRCFMQRYRDGGPVRSEINEGSQVVFVAEAPGQEEIPVGRPLVGRSGLELMRAWQTLGKKREAASYLNVLCCRPKDNKFDVMLRAYKKHVKQCEDEGTTPDLHPVEACKPRLLGEIAALTKDDRTIDIITLGKEAYQTLTGKASPISDVRGGPVPASLALDTGIFTKGGEPEDLQDLRRVLRLADIEYAKRESDRARKLEKTGVGEVYGESLRPIGVRLLPTIHPAFVLRRLRWRRAFQSDLGRASRWFSGRLDWRDPVMHLNPPVDFVRKWLHGGKRKEVAFDTETVPFDFGIPWAEPMKQRLRCIVFSDGEESLLVGWLSVDGVTRFYSDEDYAELTQIIHDFLLDPEILKIGQNVMGYDNFVTKRYFDAVAEPYLDTLPCHKSVEPELPHGLGYMGSIYTDAPSWKDDHSALTAKDDMELWRYACYDAAITFRIVPHLTVAITLRKQEDVVVKDHQLQRVACGLHENGQLVDQAMRAKFDKDLFLEAQQWLMKFRSIVGDSKINPLSGPQLRDLLYERWGLVPPVSLKKTVAYTASGDPSVSDDVILAFVTSGSLTPKQLAALDAMRRFKRAAKLRGTYVTKCRPPGTVYSMDDFMVDDGVEDESTDAEAKEFLDGVSSYFEKRLERDSKKRSALMDDGRVHASWGLGPNTGRFSSSGAMNLQNVRKKLRQMFVPQPGCVYVEADMDQLELRIMAGAAGATKYLKVFAVGGDAHAVSAEACFGEQFTKAEGDAREEIRKFAKIFTYAAIYWATIETILNVLRSTEDEAGNLLYAKYSLQQAQEVYDRWMNGVPEIPAHWARQMDLYQRQGFLLDWNWGRRFDFADGEEPNKIVNQPVQCVPGFTRVLTNRGYLPIESLRGQRFKAWTGKRWAPAAVVDRGESEVWRVEGDVGNVLYCDSRHHGKFVGREGYEWRPLVEGAQNSRFAVDLARELEFGVEADEEDAYWLGVWVSDGSVSLESDRDVCLQFTIGHEEGTGNKNRGGRAQLDRCLAWARSRGMAPNYRDAVGCWSVTVHVGGETWLKSWGADVAWKAATKRIPERVWTVDLASRKAFVRGFFDGDGYYDEDSSAVSLQLCQKRILEEMWVLLRTVGVDVNRIDGPHPIDRHGRTAYRLVPNTAQFYAAIGWGGPARERTRKNGEAPRFVCRASPELMRPRGRSDETVRSRLRGGGVTNPYLLTRCGVPDLYDHVGLASASPRRVKLPMFTLSVDDPDHQYVAEGVISQNCTGASIVHDATFELIELYPFQKWGPGTGLVNNGHDALLFEVPEKHAEEVAANITRCMTRRVSKLDVPFTAQAKIKHAWAEPKKK